MSRSEKTRARRHEKNANDKFRRIIQDEMYYLTAAPARRYIISDKEDRSNITEETSNGDMNHVL